MIYLDNAATSYPKPQTVIKAVCESLEGPFGNTGRASHKASVNSTRLIFETRELTAGYLNFRDSSHIIFTKNATESINIALFNLLPGKGSVLTSSMEHNSVMRPLSSWKAGRGNRHLRYFRHLADGTPDMNDFVSCLNDDPALLVFTAASNVNGAAFPYQEMCLKAAKKGIPSVLDASQLIGKKKMDLSSFPFSAVCFSGHKGLLGPSGTGFLVVNSEDLWTPLISGGTGSNSENIEIPSFYPDILESGTPNIPGIAGLRAALKFHIKEFPEKIENHGINLISQLKTGLSGIPGINIIPAPTEQIPIVSFTSSVFPLDYIAGVLDSEDIAVRMGLHCSPMAHKTFGTFKAGGTVRISPGYFNTEADIHKLLSVLTDLLKSSGKGKKP